MTGEIISPSFVSAVSFSSRVLRNTKSKMMATYSRTIMFHEIETEEEDIGSLSTTRAKKIITSPSAPVITPNSVASIGCKKDIRMVSAVKDIVIGTSGSTSRLLITPYNENVPNV